MGDQKPDAPNFFVSAPYMAFNFCSSVGIIFINKHLSKNLGFEFATLLTAVHFFITFLGMKICAAVGVFQPKPVPIKDVIPLAMSFCGFVVFNNLSIVYNSLSFYQIAKVMTTPVIALVQYHFFGVSTHPHLVAALSIICGGVIMSLYNDFEINMTGTIYATCGILSTSMYQIWVKTKQKDLGVDSFQLLLYQAPVASVMVLFMVPIFDNLNSFVGQDDKVHIGLRDFEFTDGIIVVVLVSAVAAFCVNLSIYLVIGKSSPISYNVLGHLKLCVIMTGSVMLFHEEVNFFKFVGILAAFGGILLYSYLKFTVKDEWDSYKGKQQDPAANDEQAEILLVEKPDKSTSSSNVDGIPSARRDQLV